MTVDFNYPYTISADTPAVAAQVQDNFADLLTWIKANYRQKDDTPLLTVMPTLPGTPTIDQHAATKAYADGIIPVATMLEYGGTALPSGFLWCDGASYSTTGVYADLFGYIGYAFGGSGGNFNVPNMANRIAVGKGTGDFATLGATGGSANAVAVAHTHGSADHTHTTADHSHTTTDHSHTYSGTTTSPGNHTHAFNTVDTPGAILSAASGHGGGNIGVVTTSASGDHSHTFSGTTSGASNGNTTSGASNGNTTSGASTGNTTNSQTPTATGVGANYPPYVVVNYIIKT